MRTALTAANILWLTSRSSQLTVSVNQEHTNTIELGELALTEDNKPK